MSPVAWGDIFTLLFRGDRIMELKHSRTRLYTRTIVRGKLIGQNLCERPKSVKVANIIGGRDREAPRHFPRQRSKLLSAWVAALHSQDRQSSPNIAEVNRILEAQRNPKKPDPVEASTSFQFRPGIHDEFEIYYLGDSDYPNEIDQGYICNFSFFEALIPSGFNASTILANVGKVFGGGAFKIMRLRDGEVIHERTFELPGPTKDEVVVMREINMGI